jgi:hypothetical protein
MPAVQSENQDPQAELAISSMPLTGTSDENISFLVEIRQRHQTKEAEKGVRTKTMSKHHTDSVSEELISERRLLAQKIRHIVKAVDSDEENTGSSTGLNRRIRWTKTPGLYSSSLAPLSTENEKKSGNSANALEVSLKAATLVCILIFCETICN